MEDRQWPLITYDEVNLIRAYTNMMRRSALRQARACWSKFHPNPRKE